MFWHKYVIFLLIFVCSEIKQMSSDLHTEFENAGVGICILKWILWLYRTIKTMQNVGKYREAEQKLVCLRQNPLEAQTYRIWHKNCFLKKKPWALHLSPKAHILHLSPLDVLMWDFTMFCFRPEKEHKSEFILDSRSGTNHNYIYNKGQIQSPQNCHRTDHTSHSGKHHQRHISNAKHSTGTGVINHLRETRGLATGTKHV